MVVMLTWSVVATAQQPVEESALPTAHKTDFPTPRGDSRWSLEITICNDLYHRLFLQDALSPPDVVPGGTFKHITYEFPIHLSGDVYYRFSERFSLGLRTTLGQETIKFYGLEGETLGRIEALPLTAVVVGKYTYHKGSEFELYGLCGVGVSLQLYVRNLHWAPSPSVDYADTIAELYPVGMRWGRRQGFFTEFGMGSKGLVHMGYFVNF